VAGVAVTTDPKKRLLEFLKRHGASTASDIAAALGVTPTAARQHLIELQRSELVTSRPGEVDGRGRPPLRWALTDLADELFPDHHADLTVDLIESIRSTLGEEALDRVIEQRRRNQLDAYRAMLPRSRSPRARVEALAQQRTAEGYMAEVVVEPDGSCLLVEHHCPICEAATACQGFCRAELSLFREALGDDVAVEREQHLLSGDSRCVYRIRRRTTRR
jgi:predicted ArsR family transcriptional regulator